MFELTDNKYLTEMARVGKFDNYLVSIYSGEGLIPHFHFYTVDGTKKGCIRLDKAQYFTHGDNTAILNSKEKKNLVEWLKSKHKALPITIWEYMVVLWDDNNEDYLMDENIKMPNYENLE